MKKAFPFLLLAVLVALMGCGEGTPEIDEITKDMAISTITEYDMVRDAAIQQEGDDLSLVVIVDFAASEEYAQSIGDNFIRLVKSLSEDDSPGKEIGTGKYNYLIGVYTPTETQIAFGAKVKSSPHITWD